MAHKVTKSARSKDRETIVVKTKPDPKVKPGQRWWAAKTDEEMANQMLGTATYLKENLQFRYRQAGIHSRLYSNIPLFGLMGGSNIASQNQSNLPIDRPTMNVVQSCVDTLVSRISQSRPRPVFLTDNAHYKQRNLAKQLNQFSNGELYQTKAYELAPLILRDASVLGTGCIKIYEDQKKRVALERVLFTELLVDPIDSLYGNPRQLYQVKLVDREVLASIFPDKEALVNRAEQAFPDNSADSSKTVSDQVLVVEGWHLPSGPEAGDGKHTIACSAGILSSEDYEKESFPFVFLHYSPRILGFFGQSLAEQLMGTQVEINKLLITITRSINLVGVPRVFYEVGSKIVKAHFNNEIGALIGYQGKKPEYEVAPCVPVEVYAQLQRLVDYAYQQSGISSLAATSQKPAGLDSGKALREYDDLQSDRFATLNKRYDQMFIDLVYQIVDKAKDIAKRDGKYQTVYPHKNGTKEIDLPATKLLDNPFVIQCFDASSLPRDPAGRLATITEMMQAGMISIAEGRRLLDYPDLEQNEKLANSGEERILQVLDQMVDEGKYTPPDPFMDLQLALEISRQYYNLYVPANLEEDKAQMIRDFNTQVQALMQAGQPPAAPGMPGNAPQAVPEAPPVSPMLPIAS